MKVIRRILLLVALCPLAACAADGGLVPAEGDGLSTISLALSGKFPGVIAMSGNVSSKKVGKTYTFGCQSYLDATGEPQNRLTFQNLPTSGDYTVLFELFGDEACTDLLFRAYRGAIAVDDQSADSAAAKPYYVQPYAIGGFVGLATASESVLEEAAKKSCAADIDCASVHPNATCLAGANVCTVTSLFPLNGGRPRVFPNVAGLGNGRVAISGGLGVGGPDDLWSATAEQVEVFNPSTGLFQSHSVANFEGEASVALGATVALAGGAFAVVGGTSRAHLSLEGTKLKVDLNAGLCSGTAVGCPVSSGVWRVSTGEDVAQGTVLSERLAFPIVARVETPMGTRVLIAGGAELPVMPAGADRVAAALLCQIDSTVVACTTADTTMSAARASASHGCVERSSNGGCTKLLILGGRAKANQPLAEIYDAQANTFTVAKIVGIPPGTILHGGSIIEAGANLYLFGASSKAFFLEAAQAAAAADIAPYVLDVDASADEPTVTFTKADLGTVAGKDLGRRNFPATIGFDDGSALLIGGIDSAGAVASDAIFFGTDGVATSRLPLDMGRFGATAARISASGPLAGCVLLVGGATTAAAGLQPLSHIEAFCPKAQP